MGRKVRWFAVWLGLAALASGSAQAAVVYYNTVLVSGRESLEVFALPLDAPGSYRITATDLRWNNTPLEALSFGVFTSTQTLETRVGAGTLEFFKAGPGQVFLQLYARTTAPRFAGLVWFKGESVAVVPLPASLLLLLSALGAAALPQLGRRLRAALAPRYAM
jgi:hypothetical protein